MIRKALLRGFLFKGLLMFLSLLGAGTLSSQALEGKVICLDPGHGDTAATDSIRVGQGGEREEWINLRVALQLADMLKKEGAEVVLTRDKDKHVDLAKRAAIAKDAHADLFISIHHNATGDTAVNFPIVYFHAQSSENQASVLLGKKVLEKLKKHLFHEDSPVSLASDMTIYPRSGTSVLRHSYGIPAIIGEASFFTQPSEERKLKDVAYNKKEALAYLEAIIAYFLEEPMPVYPKNSLVSISPFIGFAGAERVSERAARWYSYYEEGKELANSTQPKDWSKAYELLSLSVKAFAESWVAPECHQLRITLLKKMNRHQEANMEALRLKEHYVELSF